MAGKTKAVLIAAAILALMAVPALAYCVCEEPCEPTDAEIAKSLEKAKDYIGYSTEMPLTAEETAALGCEGCSGVKGSVRGYGGMDAQYIVVNIPIGGR